jgi:phasin
MAQQNPFEIPEQVRDLAERSVEQARTAYGQFMDAMLKAQSTSWGSLPATAMGTSFSDIQEQAIKFARQNAEASFMLATDLAGAKDVAAVLGIQNRFAQSQMQAYAMQAQELGRLMMTVAQRATQR